MLRISIENSKDVIKLFLALNAFGYDDENNSKGMFTVRRKARKILTELDLEGKYSYLKEVLASQHPWGLLQALFAHKTTDLLYQKLRRELDIFCMEPEVRDMCSHLAMSQHKEARALVIPFRKEIISLFSYIGKKPSDINKLVLVFNPLDAYWRGYSITVSRVGYIVVGPGAEKDHYELIRHELLHLVASTFKVPNNLIPVVIPHWLMHSGYGTRSALRNEYVVKALSLIYRDNVLRIDIADEIERQNKIFPGIDSVVRYLRGTIKRVTSRSNP